MKNIKFRKNIEKLQGYSSGKWEFSGRAEIFLDTNESPYDLWGKGNNRYPDPMQKELKEKLIEVKKQQLGVKLKQENIMIDSGSDNIIDLLVRIFCEPKEDKLAYFSPTFWMYKVAAELNNVWIEEFKLDKNFEINVKNLEKLSTEGFSPLCFICNPNNPSGNISISVENIEKLLQNFNGIVVVDEAYIDFCPKKSCVKLIEKYDNLVILQTFSKLWWLAGVRCWMAFSNKEIIEKLNIIKPPYNVNILTQTVVIGQLENAEIIFDIQKKIISERNRLEKALNKLNCVEKVFPSDSNFLLIKFEKAQEIYEYLQKKGIIVRNFSQKKLTKNCLRISVGSVEENRRVVEVLNNKKLWKKYYL